MNDDDPELPGPDDFFVFLVLGASLLILITIITIIVRITS